MATTVRLLPRVFLKMAGRAPLTVTEVNLRAVGWQCQVSQFHDDAGQGSDISNYSVPDKSTLPNDVQHRMSVMQDRTGFLPNVFKAMTHRPDEFRGFFDIYCTIMNRDGGLTMEEKELVALTTSVHNRCMYCVISHGAIHRAVSGTPNKTDQIVINPEMAKLSPRERAIVNFTNTILNLKPFDEQTYADLLHHGISREDAWDIGAVTSLFSFSNRMSHVMQVVPDDVFYAMGRQPMAAAAADAVESESKDGAVPASESAQRQTE